MHDYPRQTSHLRPRHLAIAAAAIRTVHASSPNESMTRAARDVAEKTAARRAALDERLGKMPKLSKENVENFIDWTARNAPHMDAGHLGACLNLAELTVRLHMADAQGKATQHTNIAEGVTPA